MGCEHRRISLKSGESLVFDNSRWLYGRDKLPEKSNRFLQLYWIRHAPMINQLLQRNVVISDFLTSKKLEQLAFRLYQFRCEDIERFFHDFLIRAGVM